MSKSDRRARYDRLYEISDENSPAFTVLEARRFLDDFPDDLGALVLLGSTLSNMARFGEAEQVLTRALDLCPPHLRAPVYAELGQLWELRNDHPRAAEQYLKAAELQPEEATWRIYLGALDARFGLFESAESNYRIALTCPEGQVDEAYFNLGLVYRAQERFSEAADCLRNAIRLDPEYTVANEALRDVERCLGALM